MREGGESPRAVPQLGHTDVLMKHAGGAPVAGRVPASPCRVEDLRLSVCGSQRWGNVLSAPQWRNGCLKKKKLK